MTQRWFLSRQQWRSLMEGISSARPSAFASLLRDGDKNIKTVDGQKLKVEKTGNKVLPATRCRCLASVGFFCVSSVLFCHVSLLFVYVNKLFHQTNSCCLHLYRSHWGGGGPRRAPPTILSISYWFFSNTRQSHGRGFGPRERFSQVFQIF